ncbi:hypothetical protein U0070_008424 [Myodes glareolus]|uniref:glyceraldehyde-3-phosphate dehydrogenase (phosphorylating) n=1 Tax=Myodes glareolus TaxID=447135 RepID=A0AAW0HBC4_MYOGA
MEVRAHLNGGTKRAIITAPSVSAPRLVKGVDHEKYDNSLKIFSNSSCTTNCLDPLVKVTHVNVNIVRLMTTVHASTATQKTVGAPLGSCDVIAKRLPRTSSFASTGVAKAVGKVIPELNKAHRVGLLCSTLNMSTLNLTCHLEKAAKYNDIKKVLKQAR